MVGDDEGVGRHRRVHVVSGDTRFPRREALREHRVVEVIVGVARKGDEHNYEGDGSRNTGHDKHSQLSHRYASDNHHEENDAEDHGGRREVLRDDQSADDSRKDKYGLEGSRFGAVLVLVGGEDECDGDDEYEFGELRWLEGEGCEGYVQPSCTSVDALAACQRSDEGNDGSDVAREGDKFEPTTGNVVEEPHKASADSQKSSLRHEGAPEASVFVGEDASGAVDLNERDEAEEGKDGPYHLVAVKENAFH